LLNLYKLEIFVLVADEGSMSGAAERLFMAQASVSQHIKELEHSLGVKLFERGRRGVTLTAEGERLYAHAENILRLAAEAEADLTDVRNLDGGKLTLCGTPGITTFYFASWLQFFRRDYAHIEVTLNTGTTAEVVGWVAGRTCDIGFTEGEPDADNVRATVLDTVPQYVVVGPQHPWWGREGVAMRELDGASLITRQHGSQSRAWLEEALRAHEVEVDVVAAFDAVEPIKRSVTISDRCFTVLPAYAVETEQVAGYLKTLTVTDTELTRDLWLIEHAGMPLSPVARSFLRTLKDQFPKLRSHA
jgi:DNA-binding transcriptional LysR family regulator